MSVGDDAKTTGLDVGISSRARERPSEEGKDDA